jgi:hypothetical protein
MSTQGTTTIATTGTTIERTTRMSTHQHPLRLLLSKKLAMQAQML